MDPFGKELFEPSAGAGQFQTTSWTDVVAAASAGRPDANLALARFYERYRYPVYLFIRRKGYKHEQAEDLTHDFFAKAIEKHYLADVDRGKGRFRSFLLACVQHFLGSYREKTNAAKRGGNYSFVSLDEGPAGAEPCDKMTPELAFERRWAFTLLANAMDALRAEFERAGKQEVFAVLQVFLSGEKHQERYGDVAGRLGMTEPAIRVAVHRMRSRYGSLIRAEIARTVSSLDDIEDELNYLRAVLNRN